MTTSATRDQGPINPSDTEQKSHPPVFVFPSLKYLHSPRRVCPMLIFTMEVKLRAYHRIDSHLFDAGSTSCRVLSSFSLRRVRLRNSPGIRRAEEKSESYPGGESEHSDGQRLTSEREKETRKKRHGEALVEDGGASLLGEKRAPVAWALCLTIRETHESTGHIK